MFTNSEITDWAKDTIKSEANALIATADYLNESLAEIVQILYNCKGRIIVSGIGKSAIVAQKIVATFNSTGTPSMFLHAAEAIHGDLGMIQNEDVILILSKSGESPEIKNLVNILHSWENLIIGMVNKENSYLAENANHFLYVPCEKEACPNNLAPTNSTTIQMAIGDAFAICLMKLRNFSEDDFAKYHPGGNLGKRLLLTLEDIYPNNRAPFVQLDSSLKDVLNTISQGRLGAVAVIDEEEYVLGIITDGDVRRLLQNVTDISIISAKDFYSQKPKTIVENTLAIHALELMRKNDISQLIVVDEQNRFVGFVHLHDLVKEGLG
ncbi:KpsF/GutQ family sugar-phosphate isomerase [Rhizosphaericola mali]|uniref:KpsF/GutQ family sugar-phosphate isomerase n=1 Tax=Rhizosphaericola mali TaxID=2545455 RepID=A0A5P2G0T6_9BACT|nr:KpsF/GutQ family sugar-phosphate isomerase [Rhizosphaericola mali]QES87452.1 KpsF/GutQ family sugar-phosphate isomerase [Rhizosphaericola mali]